MTDRNELERLLAAATEGPWYVSAYYSGTGPDERCSGMIVSGDDLATGIIDENEAPCGDSLSHDLDLICFLRNNAQHYLSLMDEAERLRGELGWAIETLHEINPSNYDHDDVCALNSASVEVILGLQKALGETHDN